MWSSEPFSLVTQDAGVVDSAAATGFLARTSGLDGTHVSMYKELLNGLTTDGFFNFSTGNSTLLDVLLFFATQDPTTAYLNLVNKPAWNASNVGTSVITFTQDQGVANDGTANGYISASYTPSTASGNFSRDNASFGVYTRTGTYEGSSAFMGARPVADTNDTFMRMGGGGNTYVIFNEGIIAGVDITGIGTGMYINTRKATSLTVKRYLFNATPVTNTGDTASVAVPDVDMQITSCAFLNSTTNQLAAAFIGAWLSDVQAANLAARINTALGRVGAAVY